MNRQKVKYAKAASVCLLLCSFASIGKALESLVPDTPSNAPDYFCTWNVQGYYVSYLGNLSGNQKTRAAINEANIFGSEKNQGWVNFFPEIRSDLYFVMDDSWDIPQDVNTPSNDYLGLVELDPTRFPSFEGNPQERLKAFTDKIKSYGWKGAGGWICAQESPKDEGHNDQEKYWTERLKAADFAGFDYWKVDWGRHDRDADWRKKLTKLGREHAPNLVIEHAMENQYIEFSDVFRTYDVENITAVPVTIQRVADLLRYKAKGDAKGIINCEDEPYIAVGLGCAIGIMRFPLDGNLPNGDQDFVFPPVGRDIKHRMNETIRAIRWHRIAEPFGVGGKFSIDTKIFKDYWTVSERETWMHRPIGEKVWVEAPARVSRGMPLPQVIDTTDGERPFVLASKYPNGAVAIATIGRTLDREYKLVPKTISMKLTDITAPVGIFGDYQELILIYPKKINKDTIKVYGQDLAADTPVDITEDVRIDENKLIVPGAVIRKIGLTVSDPKDVSDPGMVLKVISK